MKILVVEDDLRVSELLQRGLSEVGFNVQLAYNGKVINLGIPDVFIVYGSPDELYDLVGLSAAKIAKVMEENW